jgi:predicted lactoylglutathione lyase
MQRRHFDHIDLRVRDRARAQKFYALLLPAIGFTRDVSGERWGAFDAAGDGEAGEFFGFTEDAQHQPNESRIAFWADSRDKVDQIAAVAKRAGALNIEGPQIWTEYTPGYYAVFFEDPDGNKLEACHREQAISAE